MDNFFETYLEWIITQYNDGQNINDILNSGYTANTETYYCPGECGVYALAEVEGIYCEGESGLVCPDYSGCCVNVTASKEKIISFLELIGSPNPCCTNDKLCIETNFSPQNIRNILVSYGVVEINSSSEIYNTNLCYLFERLYNEGYSETQVYNIFIAILNIAIMIWCYDGVIYGKSYLSYKSFINS